MDIPVVETVDTIEMDQSTEEVPDSQDPLSHEISITTEPFPIKSETKNEDKNDKSPNDETKSKEVSRRTRPQNASSHFRDENESDEKSDSDQEYRPPESKKSKIKTTAKRRKSESNVNVKSHKKLAKNPEGLKFVPIKITSVKSLSSEPSASKLKSPKVQLGKNGLINGREVMTSALENTSHLCSNLKTHCTSESVAKLKNTDELINFSKQHLVLLDRTKRDIEKIQNDLKSNILNIFIQNNCSSLIEHDPDFKLEHSNGKSQPDPNSDSDCEIVDYTPTHQHSSNNESTEIYNVLKKIERQGISWTNSKTLTTSEKVLNAMAKSAKPVMIGKEIVVKKIPSANQNRNAFFCLDGRTLKPPDSPSFFSVAMKLNEITDYVTQLTDLQYLDLCKFDIPYLVNCDDRFFICEYIEEIYMDSDRDVFCDNCEKMYISLNSYKRVQNVAGTSLNENVLCVSSGKGEDTHQPKSLFLASLNSILKVYDTIVYDNSFIYSAFKRIMMVFKKHFTKIFNLPNFFTITHFEDYLKKNLVDKNILNFFLILFKHNLMEYKISDDDEYETSDNLSDVSLSSLSDFGDEEEEKELSEDEGVQNQILFSLSRKLPVDYIENQIINNSSDSENTGEKSNKTTSDDLSDGSDDDLLNSSNDDSSDSSDNERDCRRNIKLDKWLVTANELLYSDDENVTSISKKTRNKVDRNENINIVEEKIDSDEAMIDEDSIVIGDDVNINAFSKKTNDGNVSIVEEKIDTDELINDEDSTDISNDENSLETTSDQQSLPLYDSDCENKNPVSENTNLDEQLNVNKNSQDENIETIFSEMNSSNISKNSLDCLNSSQKTTRKRYHDKDVVVLSDDSENSSEPYEIKSSKKRKNIKKIISNDMLEAQTKQAVSAEVNRLNRLNIKREKTDEYYKSFSQNLYQPEKYVLEIDLETGEEVYVHPNITEKLERHQLEGIKFMWDSCFDTIKSIKEGSAGSGCILAHCMGLGKTLQVIALVHSVLTSSVTSVQKVLICCPTTVILNWVEEFGKWLNCADLRKDVKIFKLTKLKKMLHRVTVLNKWNKEGGVLIVGYEMFRRLGNLSDQKLITDNSEAVNSSLLDPGPDLVICDEGHLLKNEKTSLAKTMNRLRTKRRIVLTGTPLQNNLNEYYCMVNFIKPNLLGTHKEYMNRFINPITNGQHRDSTELDIKIMKKRSHVLHKTLEGCVQRKEASILYEYLPRKTEFVLFVTLSDLQGKLYQLYLDRIKEASNPNNLMTNYNVFRKIWTHPKLVVGDLINERDVNMHDMLTSHKLAVVFSILKECSDLNEKLIIFCTSLKSLDIIENILKTKNWLKSKDYYRMDGTVSEINRKNMCESFNSVRNVVTKLMLISTKIGGMGINLVAATRAIILDVSWNPAQDLQSVFRIYRFGQKKNCFIYRLVSQGTMEEKIYERAITKAAVSRRVVDEHQIDRHYSMTELYELYSFKKVTGTPPTIINIQNDKILSNALLNLKKNQHPIIWNIQDHDSLLRDVHEEQLNDSERREAWIEYEAEKIAIARPPISSVQQHKSINIQNSILSNAVMNNFNTTSCIQNYFTPVIEPRILNSNQHLPHRDNWQAHTELPYFRNTTNTATNITADTRKLPPTSSILPISYPDSVTICHRKHGEPSKYGKQSSINNFNPSIEIVSRPKIRNTNGNNNSSSHENYPILKKILENNMSVRGNYRTSLQLIDVSLAEVTIENTNDDV